MIFVKFGSGKWVSFKYNTSNNCTAIMLVFLNSKKREITMTACIAGNPLRPASYLMAEIRKYSTQMEQQFYIFNYLLFSCFEKSNT
jgi:hypothetical protein